MASAINSPTGVGALILIIIGILVTIIGVILVFSMKDRPWYVWLMLIVGMTSAMLGGIMMAVAYSSYEDMLKKKLGKGKSAQDDGNDRNDGNDGNVSTSDSEDADDVSRVMIGGNGYVGPYVGYPGL